MNFRRQVQPALVLLLCAQPGMAGDIELQDVSPSLLTGEPRVVQAGSGTGSEAAGSHSNFHSGSGASENSDKFPFLSESFNKPDHADFLASDHDNPVLAQLLTDPRLDPLTNVNDPGLQANAFVQNAVVAEPGTLLLLGVSLIGLGIIGWQNGRRGSHGIRAARGSAPMRSTTGQGGLAGRNRGRRR